MTLSNATKSGAFIFVGAVQFGVFLVVSEIIYSAYGTGGYSVSADSISALGANCPSGGTCYFPPSALLFDSTVALLGLFLLVGAYFLHRAYRWMPATTMLALTGIGALGVGIFNGSTGIWHEIFSLIAFFFAGVSAIVTYRFQRMPMSYFSVFLGVVTLVALFLYVPGIYLGLGGGGMERMVVYPVVLWGIGFGGHLMAKEDTAKPVTTP